MRPRPDPSERDGGEFARARARAQSEAQSLRVRAVRTVAGQAVDHEDFTRLVAMLGLEDTGARPRPRPPLDPEPYSAVALGHGLAGYVRMVAEAVQVPVEATGFEVSDTATVYLALAQRWSGLPARDLMLTWSERHGWLVAVETDPAEPPLVIDYLGGDDVVPAPERVARFVHEVVMGGGPSRPRPDFPTGDSNRAALAARLSRYAMPRLRQWPGSRAGGR